MSTIELVGNFIIYIGTVGSVLGPAVYMNAPWYKSTTGQHAMAYMVAVMSVMVLLSIRNLVGDFAGYNHLRILFYGMVTITVWWRFLILIGFWRKDREYDAEHDGSRSNNR